MDLTSKIEELALKPKSIQGEAGSVELRGVDEVIQADNREKIVEAAKKPHRGIRFTKIIAPGA